MEIFRKDAKEQNKLMAKIKEAEEQAAHEEEKLMETVDAFTAQEIVCIANFISTQWNLEGNPSATADHIS